MDPKKMGEEDYKQLMNHETRDIMEGEYLFQLQLQLSGTSERNCDFFLRKITMRILILKKMGPGKYRQLMNRGIRAIMEEDLLQLLLELSSTSETYSEFLKGR